MKNVGRLNRKVAQGLIVVALSLFGLLNVDSSLRAGDLIQVQNLAGQWKFTINEKEAWIYPSFNDKDWVNVKVPSPWEDQGFYGYNGFGFYRKSFTVSSDLKGKTLYLKIGYIDDVDETYINGQKIGSTGSFPPDFNTAYNALRVYAIPEGLLKYGGVNTIAVKVYDTYQAGGIVSGDIGLYTDRFDMPLDINLQGKWKFRIGDDLSRKNWKLDDSNWDEIFVPAKWEDQGYRDYDGFAWYRKTFSYKGNFSDEKVVLVLGKIDDVDQVYINGVLVGATGEFSNKAGKPVETGDRYKAFRGYYIPTSLLKKNQDNTIAVRVYDSGGVGGIYEGPVGIISQPNYIRYWRERKGLSNE
jgi:hypothetical protein